MSRITKQVVLHTLQCPVLGWHTRHHGHASSLSLGERFRIDQGKEIGRRARQCFPGGILIAEHDPGTAAVRTGTYLDDESVPALFEPAFLAEGCTARADILVRNGDAWELIEVKSGSRQRPEYLDDLAYTAMVLTRAGVTLGRTSLMLVNRNYRLGMPPESLFTTTDCTAMVRDRVGELEILLPRIDAVTAAAEPPEPLLRFACRSCSRFDGCAGNGIDHHIFEIPHLKPPRFEALLASGITSIYEIPATFPLTPRQRRVVDCIQQGTPHIAEALPSELAAISFPAFYLDFEAVQTAIPPYEGLAPYEQIPTQYSVHCCDEDFRILSHSEYLADPADDFRRTLAASLLADLEGEGSILIYSSFEKTMVTGLAKAFPDLAACLKALRGRMVDLEAIIRAHVCHPGFSGSTSIKKTLPALVPGMSYEGMAIAEGESAAAAFAYLARGAYPPEEAAKVRSHLLDYCAQDTLAMVKLHEVLADLCTNGPSTCRSLQSFSKSK